MKANTVNIPLIVAIISIMKLLYTINMVYRTQYLWYL